MDCVKTVQKRTAPRVRLEEASRKVWQSFVYTNSARALAYLWSISERPKKSEQDQKRSSDAILS